MKNIEVKIENTKLKYKSTEKASINKDKHLFGSYKKVNEETQIGDIEIFTL